MKICFIASGGGHLEELSDLIEHFSKYDHYIVTEQEIHKWKKNIHIILHIKRSIIRLIKNIFQSLIIFIKMRPEVIITTGSIECLPTVFFAKSLKIPIIYIESYCRIHELSKTGKVMKYLASYFFCQWKNLEKYGSNIRYCGPIFNLSFKPSPVNKITSIFIITGTAAFQFNRVLEIINNLIKNHHPEIKVVAQIGHISKFKSEKIKTIPIFPKDTLEKLICDADVIISHAGIGTIINVLKKNKPLIVVPRQQRYNEAIDDHQLEIAQIFSKLNIVKSCTNIDEIQYQLFKNKMKGLKPFKSSNILLLEKIENIINHHSSMNKRN